MQRQASNSRTWTSPCPFEPEEEGGNSTSILNIGELELEQGCEKSTGGTLMMERQAMTAGTGGSMGDRPLEHGSDAIAPGFSWRGLGMVPREQGNRQATQATKRKWTIAPCQLTPRSSLLPGMEPLSNSLQELGQGLIEDEVAGLSHRYVHPRQRTPGTDHPEVCTMSAGGHMDGQSAAGNGGNIVLIPPTQSQKRRPDMDIATGFGNKQYNLGERLKIRAEIQGHLRTLLPIHGQQPQSAPESTVAGAT